VDFFKASGDTQTQLMEVSAEGILVLESATFDTIVHGEERFLEDTRVNVFKIANKCFEDMTSYPTGEDVQQVQARSW
jgi:hypothetical protein